MLKYPSCCCPCATRSPTPSCGLRYKRPLPEIEKHIDKITALEDRFDLYVQVELWRKAVDVATKLRDPNRLIEVKVLTETVIATLAPFSI